jgi:hypothetical protein
MAEHTVLAADFRQQRRRARRSALLLGLVALAVYGFYIVFALRHGHA